MINNYYQRGNLSFKDKILSLDFTLIFLVLLLGVIVFLQFILQKEEVLIITQKITYIDFVFSFYYLF